MSAFIKPKQMKLTEGKEVEVKDSAHLDYFIKRKPD